MTVATNDTIERYVIAGVGPYAYTWRIFNDADLQVYALSTASPPVPTLLTLLTHYTVTGANVASGGSITLTAAAVASYTGYTLDIRANTPQNQPTSIRNIARFLPEIHEDAYDYLSRQIQDLERQVKASLRYPDNVLGDAAMTPLSSWVSKYVTVDGTGALAPAVLTSSGAITQNLIGGLLYPLSVTEGSAAAAPSNFGFNNTPEDTRRYGSVDTGGATDSTTAIQNTINALNAGTIKGGAVVIPGDANSIINISNSLSIPKRTAGDNHTRWYSLRGMGRGAPRLTAVTGLANKPMIDASGQDSSTFSYYREYKDLYLNGAGIAQKGIDIRFNQHFKLENLFITAMEDGAGTGAGIEVFGAICASFRDLKVHDSEGHGIFVSGGSGNFFNANLIEGCSFLNLTGDGIYSSGGFAGNSVTGNTFENCNYGIRLAGFGAVTGSIDGNYFEQNKVSDLFIGEDTFVQSLLVEGNYLNGYSSGNPATYDNYTPIRMKFADGVELRSLTVATNTKSPNGFRFLDANIAGGSVSNCIVEGTKINGLSSATAPNTIYNLPGTWVQNGNRLYDPTFAPLIKNNINRGRLPYGGWSLNVGGAGTVARGADILGAPAVRMTRPAGGDTSQIAQTFTIGKEFKNRFVTVAIPILSACANLNIAVAITPNGTSPQTTTITTNSLAVGDQTILYAMGFAPADATTIAISVTLNNSTTDFTVGHPCLYVGAEQWYDGAGDEDWYNDTAPATGTWVDGDKVWANNMAAATSMGNACVTSGTPGTWKAMPALAA